MSPVVGPLGARPLGPVADYVAAAQQRPQTHIGYVGTESVHEELADFDDFDALMFVAEDDGRVTGALLAEIDDAMRRVWWVGPWADRRVVADRLYAVAVSVTGDRFSEEELAPDDRNGLVAEFAGRHGFVAETASVVLSAPASSVAAVAVLDEPDPDAAGAVARLHDELFPGTHLPGASLVEPRPRALVRCLVGDDGVVVGYVAAEVQADGSAYIDFLGVHPGRRRQGHAKTLVGGVVRELVGVHDVTVVNLTVRETSGGARALYRSLGFTEERLIRPFRKGFSLG